MFSVQLQAYASLRGIPFGGTDSYFIFDTTGVPSYNPLFNRQSGQEDVIRVGCVVSYRYYVCSITVRYMVAPTCSQSRVAVALHST